MAGHKQNKLEYEVITNGLEGGETSSGAVIPDGSLGDGTLPEVGSRSF